MGHKANVDPPWRKNARASSLHYRRRLAAALLPPAAPRLPAGSGRPEPKRQLETTAEVSGETWSLETLVAPLHAIKGQDWRDLMGRQPTWRSKVCRRVRLERTQPYLPSYLTYLYHDLSSSLYLLYLCFFFPSSQLWCSYAWRGGDGVTACSRRRLRLHSIFSIANVFKNRF